MVRLRGVDHAVIILGRHVEMHEVYSSVCSFRGEGKDESRIRVTAVKFGRAPGLDHEPLRDDLEYRTGERTIEGSEWRTRLDADRHRRASDRRMLRRISVHREETFSWGRQDDRLGNDASHDTRLVFRIRRHRSGTSARASGKASVNPITACRHAI